MKNRAGFSLIEVILSAALVATAVGALFAAASMAIRLSSGGQDRLIAAHLARQGIDTVRMIRDTNVIANECQPIGSECRRVWTDGILDSPLPLTAKIFKHIDTAVPPSLETISDREKTCTDYLVRNTTPGQGGITSLAALPSVSTPSSQLFCRRIIVEPVTDLLLATDAIRIRSQVAWLGNGKKSFRTLDEVAASSSCSGSGETESSAAKEWCTEQVTLLTGWRGQQ